jgi:hypothetical protein
MSSRPELRLDWCSHEAAKYAVEKWHYSRTMPPPPMMHIGAWESRQFIGCVLFARGASAHLLLPYGLKTTEGCELVRIALSRHSAPVSRIVRIALKMLSTSCPGIRLVVSFADPSKGHHGGVYQAGGWIYAGDTSPNSMYLDRSGKLWHNRMISSSGVRKVFGKYRKVLRPSDCKRIDLPGKHRYLMPLDQEMRERIAHLARPYPKRAGSADSGTPAVQAGRGGATPTPALLTEEAADANA